MSKFIFICYSTLMHGERQYSNCVSNKDIALWFIDQPDQKYLVVHFFSEIGVAEYHSLKSRLSGNVHTTRWVYKKKPAITSTDKDPTR